MTKLKALYLCGDQSRYGLAHLEAILNNFDVVSVVVGTDKTWEKFRRVLKGGKQYEPPEKIIQVGYRFARKVLSVLVSVLNKKNRKSNVEYICREKRVPVLKIEDVNDLDFVKLIEKLNFDVLLSAAYPQIFKKELLSLAQKGSINFHPSLLPKYRGAHPHFWSIAKGDVMSGVTAHFMTESIDDGDIVAQISFPIKEYYYSELYNRIEIESVKLVEKVSFFLNSSGIPQKQDASKVSYFRNDRDIHRRIFWEFMNAQDIFNLIRTENSFFFIGKEKVFPKRARIVGKNRNMTNDVSVPPGVVVDITHSELVVSTSDRKQFLSITNFGKGLFKQKGVTYCTRKYKVSVGMRLS